MMITDCAGDGYQVVSSRPGAAATIRHLAYRRPRGGVLGLLGGRQEFFVSSPATIMVLMGSGRARDGICADLARHFAVETDGGVLAVSFAGSHLPPADGMKAVLFDRLSEQVLVHRAEPLLRVGGSVRLVVTGSSAPGQRAELLVWLAERMRGFSVRSARPVLLLLEGLEPAFSNNRMHQQLLRAQQDFAAAGFSQVVVLDPTAARDPLSVLESELTFYDAAGQRSAAKPRLVPAAFPLSPAPTAALLPVQLTRGRKRAPQQSGWGTRARP